jgi:hypothetical protein
VLPGAVIAECRNGYATYLFATRRPRSLQDDLRHATQDVPAEPE